MNSNKSAFLAILFLYPIAAFNGRSQSTFLTNGLVAYYPFNGNANDASGYGNNGTVHGAALTTDKDGDPNAAYFFNGTSSSISAPYQNYLSFPSDGDLTVSAWAAFKDSPSQSKLDTFLVGLDNGGGAQAKWIFFYGKLNIPNPPAGDYAGFNIFDPATQMSYWLAPALFEPGLNSWHHYVVTKSGTNYTTYIDGLQASNGTNYSYENTTQFSGPGGPLSIPTGITAPLTIGEAENGGWMDGELNDIRIYNRALSTNEIEQLYVYEGCTPHRAIANATVTNGMVVGATVTDAGCGYTNTPQVLVLGGGGTNATATAIMNNGLVTGITITDVGAGYTGIPTIYIYSPMGLQIGLQKAVYPTFSDLTLGTNYQLQVSGDLSNWTNTGSPFIATNPVEDFSQYFNVTNWGQLYFRLQVQP